MVNSQSENDQMWCRLWPRDCPERAKEDQRKIAHSTAVESASVFRPKSDFSSSILILLILSSHFTAAFGAYREVFTDQWAVKINGGLAVANRLAEKHGFKNLGEVYFLFFSFFKNTLVMFSNLSTHFFRSCRTIIYLLIMRW